MAENQSILMAREKVYRDQLLELDLKKLDLPVANQDKLDVLINDIKTKLDQINTKLGSSEPKNTETIAYITSMKISNLASHFKSISKFLPGGNLESWIDELDRLYAVYIADELNDYPSLEISFVRLCKTYLDKVLFTQMLNSQVDTDTYDKFRTYMLKNHGSRQSVFSFLQKPFDSKLQGNIAVTTFASKLDKSMREAQLRISEKFKSDHNGTEIQAKHVFSIMSSMLISEQLRLHKPTIYALMTKKMDKMWSPISIAQEAQVFLDRGIGSHADDGYQVSAGSTGGKGKSDKRTTRSRSTLENRTRTSKRTSLSSDEYKKAVSNGECVKFKVNRPCKTTPCPYKHVDKYGKLVSNVLGHGNTHAKGRSNERDNGDNFEGNLDSTAATDTTGYGVQTNKTENIFEPITFQ